jgi:hypothetical protein
MRVNSFQLIKFCFAWPVPAAETKSIGLRADPAFGEGRRAGTLFFAPHLDYFIMTRNFSSTYRDWQKTMHLDPPVGGTATH